MATIDEDLTSLDDGVRRLKIEYDVYFGGGSKKPPTELEWRVSSLIKRYSDSSKMSFAQRFRYNAIVQKYSIFNALWQQKLKIREEGYRRPADALLAVQGLRTEQEHEAAAALNHKPRPQEAFAISCSNPEHERPKIQQLFDAMIAARRRVGEPIPPTKFDSFFAFVKAKTDQIKRDSLAHAVEYRVEVEDGKVRLKARAK